MNFPNLLTLVSTLYLVFFCLFMIFLLQKIKQCCKNCFQFLPVTATLAIFLSSFFNSCRFPTSLYSKLSSPHPHVFVPLHLTGMPKIQVNGQPIISMMLPVKSILFLPNAEGRGGGGGGGGISK